MSEDSVSIDMGGSLGIAQVAELHARLSEARFGTEHLTLNISRLERVDTAAVQLLYCLQRDLRAEGRLIHWSRPSPQLVEVVNRLGMDRRFSFGEDGQ